MNVKIGQGFFLNSHLGKQYCLIVNAYESNVEYIRVNAIVTSGQPRVRMYNDADADAADTDKDNVCLSDCPPPFSDLSFKNEKGERVNNAYAVATTQNDLLKPKRMSMFNFEQLAEIIDNGACISDKDMNTVRNHSCVNQRQKEKTYNTDKNAAAESICPWLESEGTDDSYDVFQENSLNN